MVNPLPPWATFWWHQLTITLVTSCFLGRRIGYFKLQFRKEFFNLSPTRRMPLISRETSNLWMVLDLGNMLLPFHFKISVTLQNNVSWTICTILASASFNSFTDKTLLFAVAHSTLLFHCWANFIPNVIPDSNSSFQLVCIASICTCFLTSGSSMLSSDVVSITFQVYRLCHKNAGPWDHLSTLFLWLTSSLLSCIYVMPLVNIWVIPEKLHTICDKYLESLDTIFRYPSTTWLSVR